MYGCMDVLCMMYVWFVYIFIYLYMSKRIKGSDGYLAVVED